jgi:hypothetical protein
MTNPRAPETTLVCACGEAVKPCPRPLDPPDRRMCRGYVHAATFVHGCPGRYGLAEPGLAEPAQEKEDGGG